MRNNKIIVLIQFLLIFFLYLYTNQSKNSREQSPANPAITAKSSSFVGNITTEGIIRYGENLWEILKKHHVAQDEISPAIERFRNIYDPRDLKAGHRYQIILDSTRQLIRYEYRPEVNTVYRVERDSSGEFAAKIIQKPLTRKIQTLSGTIQTSLYESMIEQGASPELIISFTDIFQWDVDFFVEPQRGDSYKLVYEAFYLDSVFVRYGQILAASFVRGGQTLTAFYYRPEDGKKGGYYQWNGQSVQKKFLKSPLNYRRISSYFSLGRRHPILKRVRPHYGVDFAAPAGTPVVAPADGVVIETGYQRGGVGRYLKIRHNGTHFTTLYGHLRAFARGIRKGVRVSQRQVIGYVGATGLATGPHLHYTFYENGRPINPLRIQNASADPLPSAEIQNFQQAVMPYLSILARIDAPSNQYCVRLR